MAEVANDLLLGYRMESEDTDERELEPRSTFVIYSLRTHQVVKLLPLPGLAHSFVPNENFVVIVSAAFCSSTRV